MAKMRKRLSDRALSVERYSSERRRRKELPPAFGDFISELADWSWFINPITFRGDSPAADAALQAISEWFADLQTFVGPHPIGWMLAEEFGRIGGRWHCHGLVAGVAHVHRRFWWAEAFRRFGRTAIHPFDPKRAAAFYAAKYAAKALGRIHFGGTLAGKELNRLTYAPDGRRSWSDSLKESSPAVATHGVVAPSANVERDLFRMSLGRWHR